MLKKNEFFKLIIAQRISKKHRPKMSSLNSIIDEKKMNHKENPYCNTLMMVAIQDGKPFPEVLKEYKKEEIETKNGLGETVLIYAAKFSGAKLVRFLLDEKANVNEIDNLGRTPLMGCCMYSPINANAADIVKHLVEAGASLNLRDDDGNTAIAYAKKGGMGPKVISFLLEKGAQE